MEYKTEWKELRENPSPAFLPPSAFVVACEKIYIYRAVGNVHTLSMKLVMT